MEQNLLGNTATPVDIEAGGFLLAGVNVRYIVFRHFSMHISGSGPPSGRSLFLLGQAWAEREANLHRGLMQYAIKRPSRNPQSRTIFL